MPNKEGGYGGYRRQDRRSAARKVRAPGAEGGVRRGVQPPPAQPYHQTPYTPRMDGNGVRPARYDPDALEEDWVPADRYTAPRPQQDPPPPPRRPRSEAERARRLRQRRRARRRGLLLATVVGILAVSGVITLLLPESATVPAGEQATAETAALATRLVAPLPYSGGSGEDTALPALDWGSVGPVRQDETRTYTALPAAPDAVPEFGRVTTEWFADAVFLGDSLTVGYSDYGINVGGARILGYEGVSPNTFVNRTVVKNANDEDEVPLDVLAGLQPKKLYLMVGTNALVVEGNDEGFLNYYARLLDELGTMLPDCMIFVQSVLPVRPEALADAPGLASARLESINASLRAMCAEKGCYYLDVASAFRGEDGALLAEYAQPDGIHLTVSGYTAWVDYLCTHVPYDKNNPYQPGSAWYLDAGLKDLIADIP